MSRRELLRAAGGLTFLALLPVGRGLFALPVTDGDAATGPVTPDRPILFTAAPYIQPGPGGGPLVEGGESMVLAWQTDDTPAEFIVEYGSTPSYGHRAELRVARRGGSSKSETSARLNYAALLTGLRLGAVYYYRVHPANGFAVQVRYDTDTGQEDLRMVRDGDVAAIASGFHPLVAATGHGLYYLWVLAGEQRAMRVYVDPRYRWVLDQR